MKLKLKSIACVCSDRGVGRPCRNDVVITGADRSPQTMHDRPLLAQALRAEGYEVDTSEYTHSEVQS